MMCCATGLPVPDWVRGMCAPVPRSSTHTTGVLLVLNQRRTRQWSQTRMRAGTLSLDFQNTHPSVIIRYPFRALLHANLFPRARVAAPRLGTQVTDLLRVWNLDCFCRVPEIGISTTPEASLPDRLQSVPSTLFTSRPSERPSAALARASFRLSQLSFSRSPRAKKGAIARRAVPSLLSVPGPICWSHWAML
jgi:hypothetical protein